MTKDKARKRATRTRAAENGDNYTTAHRSDPHLHDGWGSPDEDAAPFGIAGRIDMAPIGLLVGACMDRCLPCQAKALDQLAAAPASAARFVELVGISVMDAFGGLPRNMWDDTAPGVGNHDPGLRAALRAAMGDDADSGGVDRAALYEVVAALTPAARRVMCDNGADTLIGQLATGPQGASDLAMAAGGPVDVLDLGDGRTSPVFEMPSFDPRLAGLPDGIKAYEVFLPDLDGDE